jgi:hypothetical protein
VTRRTKALVWVVLAVVALAALGTKLWIRELHHYAPVEAVQDVRAAIQAKDAPQPVERFLELRYGPLSDPENRQRAFLDFFNIGHIKGLHFLASRMGNDQMQASTAAMAQWVANYRTAMTPEERASLGAYVRSDVGRATIQQAAAQYLQQDVRFRASTASVIQELMTTVATVQKE